MGIDEVKECVIVYGVLMRGKDEFEDNVTNG